MVPVPTALREQLRDRAENIQNNIEVRNKLLETRRISSSTRAEREDERENRREENQENRREKIRDMRLDIFKVRKNALVKQLSISIENLKQIRERIKSRIEKASESGRNMDQAKSALAIADSKITIAINAVESLKEYVPTTSTTVATASTTSTSEVGIDLGKPRQIGDAAIKAVKEAHAALVSVVKAIAHSMGFGNNATTTPSTTTDGNSSATSTATTTATTTTQ